MLFKEHNIPEKITEPEYCFSFDKFYNDYTKIYPVSGGLSSSLNYQHILKKKDILYCRWYEKGNGDIEWF